MGKVAAPFPELSGVAFRLISGWPVYAISDDGRVWSCLVNRHQIIGSKWRELKAAKSNDAGHRTVTLCHDGRRKNHLVHRMVLEAFIGPCPEGMEACHFPDRDPMNCAINNLRWDTKKGNARDRKLHGTECRGESKSNVKLTDEKVREIRVRYAVGDISQEKLGTKYGVHQTAIGFIVRRVEWRYIA